MKRERTYKTIIALLFVIVFFAQNFSSTLIIADYYADTQAYAAKCINKNKPQMHCNGKCELQKKLNEVNNKDKQSAEHKNESGFEVLSSKSFFACINATPQIYLERIFFSFNSKLASANTVEFFHPPSGFFI